MQKSDSINVECTITHETDAAVLINTPEQKSHWIPLSQVEKIVRRPDQHCTITMTRWIAQQKGLV